MNKLIIVYIFILTFVITTARAVADELSLQYASAESYWKNGEYSFAAEKFKLLRKQNTPEGERAAFAYALSQEKAGDISQAEEGYLYFIKFFPESSYITAAQQRLINLFLENAEYAKANFFLHTLVINVADSKTEQKKDELIIFSYINLLQYSNAERSINQYIRKYPNADILSLYRIWLAWYYNKLNNNQAETIYLEIIQDGKNIKYVTEAKAKLVGLLLKNNAKSEAVAYMLDLIGAGYQYSNTELLWLAKYLAEIRELAVASEVLSIIIDKPESNMLEAIALNDLALIQTDDRKLHDALSNFPLVRKALLNSSSSIGKIELLGKMVDYSNAMALRKIGSIGSAHAILDKLEPEIYEPLYYKILYEQGLVSYSMGDVQEAAKKLMQVGILARDPDLAGKALLQCYDACQAMNNHKLMKVCLEELSGKNEGSYGKLYPNSPYTAQAYEIIESVTRD